MPWSTEIQIEGERKHRRAVFQWSPGYDDPYPSICEAAGAGRGRWSQGPVVHQKGAWMKTEDEEEEEAIESERAAQLAAPGSRKQKQKLEKYNVSQNKQTVSELRFKGLMSAGRLCQRKGAQFWECKAQGRIYASDIWHIRWGKTMYSFVCHLQHPEVWSYMSWYVFLYMLGL